MLKHSLNQLSRDRKPRSPRGETRPEGAAFGSADDAKWVGMGRAEEDGLVVRRTRADSDGDGDGRTSTEEVVHPGIKADARGRSRQRELCRELQVYPPPDRQPWSEYTDREDED